MKLANSQYDPIHADGDDLPHFTESEWARVQRCEDRWKFAANIVAFVVKMFVGGVAFGMAFWLLWLLANG